MAEAGKGYGARQFRLYVAYDVTDEDDGNAMMATMVMMTI